LDGQVVSRQSLVKDDSSHSTRSQRSVDYDSGDDIGEKTRKECGASSSELSATSIKNKISALEKKSRKHKSKKQDANDVIYDESTPPWLAKALETEQVKNLPVDATQEAIPEHSSLQGSLILPDETIKKPKKPGSQQSFGCVGESSWLDLEFEIGLPSQYVVSKREEASVADSKSKSQDSSVDTKKDEKDTSIRSLKPVQPNGKPNEYSIGSIMDGFPKLSILDQGQAHPNSNPGQNPGESTCEMEKLSGHGRGDMLKDIVTTCTHSVGVGTDPDCTEEIDIIVHESQKQKTKALQNNDRPIKSQKSPSRKSAHSKDGDGSLCGMEIQVGGAPMSDVRRRLLTKISRVDQSLWNPRVRTSGKCAFDLLVF
jgi:hypothetical protein